MHNNLDQLFASRILDEIKTMSDAELVRHYVDMHNGWKNYSHSYQDHLENYLYVHALALLENRIATKVIKTHGYHYDVASERYIKDQRVSH